MQTNCENFMVVVRLKDGLCVQVEVRKQKRLCIDEVGKIKSGDIV